MRRRNAEYARLARAVRRRHNDELVQPDGDSGAGEGKLDTATAVFEVAVDNRGALLRGVIGVEGLEDGVRNGVGQVCETTSGVEDDGYGAVVHDGANIAILADGGQGDEELGVDAGDGYDGDGEEGVAVFGGVDAAEEEGAVVGVEVVEVEGVGVAGDDVGIGERGGEVVVGAQAAVVDLGFVDRVAESEDALWAGGGVADAELEGLDGEVGDVEGVRGVVAESPRAVDVGDVEDGVYVAVCGGAVGGVLAGEGAVAAAAGAEAGLGAVDPEVAAAGVDVEAEGLGRRAEGDVGEVEGFFVGEGGLDGAIASSEAVVGDKVVDIVASLNGCV